MSRTGVFHSRAWLWIRPKHSKPGGGSFHLPNCFRDTSQTNQPTNKAMQHIRLKLQITATAGAIALFSCANATIAAPFVRRLTPPSALFDSGDPDPPIIG